MEGNHAQHNQILGKDTEITNLKDTFLILEMKIEVFTYLISIMLSLQLRINNSCFTLHNL